MPHLLVTTMDSLIIMFIDLYSCYVSLYLLFSTNLNLLISNDASVFNFHDCSPFLFQLQLHQKFEI